MSRDVKQLPLRRVHLVKLHLVGDIGDALLGRNYGPQSLLTVTDTRPQFKKRSLL